jgi:hypothetical protein
LVTRIVGSNSRRTKIELELPIDINGEYAFDENENPVEDSEPIVLVLPRYNYMPIDDLVELQKNVNEVENRETSDDYTSAQRSREMALATLRPFITDEQHKAISVLSLGELEQISSEWAAQSAMPLGESPASAGSSKNTQGRSSSTSSRSRATASAT